MLEVKGAPSVHCFWCKHEELSLDGQQPYIHAHSYTQTHAYTEAHIHRHSNLFCNPSMGLEVGKTKQVDPQCLPASQPGLAN